MTTSKITWTHTDEAPALATKAFFPILQAYTKNTGVELEIADISLAGRIIARRDMFGSICCEYRKLASMIQLDTRKGAKRVNGRSS